METETALGRTAETAPGEAGEFLLDQKLEQEYEVEEEQRENELLLTEDAAVEGDFEKIIDTESASFLENEEEGELLGGDEDTEDAAPLFDVAPFIAAAAAVSSDPSLDNVRSVNELAGVAKRSGGTQQQIVILHLLESATALIGQKSEPDTDDQVVVQELAAGLEFAAEDPFELTALVHHYTAWQQDFFRRVMASKEEQPVQHAAPSPSVVSDCISNKDAVHQVQEGFSQLREAMVYFSADPCSG